MTAAAGGMAAAAGGRTGAVTGGHVIPVQAGSAGSEAPLAVPHRWPGTPSFPRKRESMSADVIRTKGEGPAGETSPRLRGNDGGGVSFPRPLVLATAGAGTPSFPRKRESISADVIRTEGEGPAGMKSPRLRGNDGGGVSFPRPLVLATAGGGDPVIPAQAGIHVGQCHPHRRRKSGRHDITLAWRRFRLTRHRAAPILRRP